MIPPYDPVSQDFGSVRTFQSLRDMVMGFFQRNFDNLRVWLNQTLLQSINTFSFNYGADIASAQIISPTALVHQVTGSVTVQTINPPANFAGLLVLFSHDGFSTNTSGNISQAFTVSTGHVLILAYHPVLGKWNGTTT